MLGCESDVSAQKVRRLLCDENKEYFCFSPAAPILHVNVFACQQSGMSAVDVNIASFPVSVM